MRDFARSLRYLKPYRVRIALALVCAVLISVLWAGGLAMVLPAGKILLSPEGLHGWVHRLASGDRLGARLAPYMVPEGTRAEGQPLSWVLQVEQTTHQPSSSGATSRSQAAGLSAGDWLVGLADGEPAHRFMRADALVRQLAQADAGSRITIRLVRGGGVDTVTLAAGKLSATHGALLDLAGRFTQPQSYADRFPMLLAILILGLATNILRGALRVGQEYLSASAVLYAINDLRADNYNRALRLPVSYFDRRGIADTISRFMQDVNMLARGQVTLLGKTLVEPAKAVGAMAVAMSLSWELTLVALVAGPPAMLAIRRLGKAMHRASRQALQGLSDMLALLEETLGGIRVVKAYTMENQERRRFLRVNRQLLGQNLRMFLIDSLSGPVVEAMGLVAAMAAVALAGYWVLHGQHNLDPEKFLALLACLVAMFDPVRKLSSVSTVFHASDAAAGRVMELHDTPGEATAPGAVHLPRHSQDIEFRNVSFRYEGAADLALREVSLHVKAGERVALVGPNGSGKTTLVSLIPRLLEPTAGQVLIDGTDIARCSLRSLRRQIGLVTQEAVLFHATIEQNIAYGLRRASPDKTRQAAGRAYVDEFVRQLPESYRTLVGPRGATLSGGQRQRIAIARAILRDPAILIFDEAMSQVDPESEQRIQQALAEFSRGRTTLVVAHRFSTVLLADRIVVMQEGRIADTGTHDELMARCGLYRDLYRTQLAASTA